MPQPAVVQHELAERGVELREVPVPDPAAGSVLLRVGAVGVCGSDVHQYLNEHSWPVNIPVILGHEFAGVVEAVGAGVTEVVPGDRVVSETAAEICGRCALCRTGRYHLCPERKGFGYGRDGAMTQRIDVPARCLHKLPDGLPLETAALCEPCCVAYHATAIHGDIKPGMSVAVLGCGPIGLLCVQVAKLCGANPLVLTGRSVDEPRLHLGQQLGADHTVAVDREDLRAMSGWLGDGLGFDVVIDAVGANAGLHDALDIVRPGGRIAKVGWGPGPVGFSIDPLVQKAVTLQGSFSHHWLLWERVLNMLATEQLDVAPIISLRLPLERWQEGFEAMHASEAIKALLLPNGSA